MQRRHWLFLALVPMLMSSASAQVKYPESRRTDQVDDYFGTKVADPYRWLEDDNSAETAAWVEAQNAVTFGFLAQIPARAQLRTRLTELWNYERYGVPSREGPFYVFAKNDGLQNQSVIYRARSLDAAPEVLLDPNTLSADGTVALGAAAFTDDGARLAYALARSGSDWHEWRVREVATGKDLADVVQWSKFSEAAWTKDGAGFYYGRFAAPKPGEELHGVNTNQQVYFHRIGDPQDKDRLVYERPDHPDWGFNPSVTDDGRFLLIAQSQGTENKNRVFVQDLSKPGSAIQPFLDAFDAYYTVIGNDGDTFYVATDKDAPRGKLVAITLGKAAPAAWTTIIPEGPTRDVLDAVTMLGNRFVATWQIDANQKLRVYGLTGAPEREIALPTLGSVGFSSKRKGTEGFYSFTSFTYPTTIFRYDPATGQSTVYRRPSVTFAPDAYETTQVFYPSKDGTKVPMFITAQEGAGEERPGAGDPLRLRRVQHLADARLLGGHGGLARDGGHLRGAEPARRRRVRQGVARRRPAGTEAERVRRLHRGRRVPDSRASTRPRRSSRSPAAATAACSWARR